MKLEMYPLPTREAALILLVFTLADGFSRLFNAEVERRQTELPRPWMEVPDEG